MVRDYAPRCEYPKDGTVCGALAAPQPTRLALDDRHTLEMLLCDEHFEPLDRVYETYASFARKLGASEILKRLDEAQQAHEPALYQVKQVGPPSKKKNLYVLNVNGEGYTLSQIRVWCERERLTSPLGFDGKPKRGPIDAKFIEMWARAMTADALSDE